MTAKDTYIIGLNKLNKLISNTSQDVPEYLWVYNFNEAQSHWIANNYKLAEKDTSRIHNLSNILVSNIKLTGKVNKLKYTEFDLPKDYLNYSSSETHINECPFVLENHLWEEHNIKTALKDAMWLPSKQFEETLVTIANNKLLVYQLDFEPNSVIMSYYRKPVQIDIADGFTHTDGSITLDVDPEFDDQSVYEIIDLAVQQIAASFGDTSIYNTSSQHIKETE